MPVWPWNPHRSRTMLLHPVSQIIGYCAAKDKQNSRTETASSTFSGILPGLHRRHALYCELHDTRRQAGKQARNAELPRGSRPGPKFRGISVVSVLN
jgi:hypothetical protein